MNDLVVNALLAGPAVIATIEVLRHWNIVARLTHLQVITVRSAHVLTSKRISDHWKELSLRRYACTIMKEASVVSLQALLALTLLVGIYGSLGTVFAGAEFELMASVMSAETQVIMALISIAYLFLRFRIING